MMIRHSLSILMIPSNFQLCKTSYMLWASAPSVGTLTPNLEKAKKIVSKPKVM